MDNLEEYLELTTTFMLETGIARQMEALRAGFNQVFLLRKLHSFTPAEVRVMLCGDQNPQWTREDVLNYTEPKLGYTKDRYVMVLPNNLNLDNKSNMDLKVSLRNKIYLLGPKTLGLRPITKYQ